MSTPTLPEPFVQKTLDLFGETGREWLNNLPAFLSLLADRWELKLLPPFELSYNYVAPAVRRDGSEVVLKTWLVNVEMLSEMESLRLWNGRGIVQLLEHDPRIGALLLERPRPGTVLADVDDDQQSTRAAAEVMRQLWIDAPPDPHGLLRTAAGWARGMDKLRDEFGGGTGPFPPHLVEAAESLFAGLLTSTGPMRLLHGDLHHWNILSAKRQPWLALDPKGLIGEAEYEPGAFLRNRWPSDAPIDQVVRFMDQRIAIFCEMLPINRERVTAWAMAQAVLSAWWSYEDHHQVDHETLYLADALLRMVG